MSTAQDFALSPQTCFATDVMLSISISGTPFQQISILQSETLIGRGACCDVQLTDPTLPVVHSEIRRQGDVYWIEAFDDSQQILVNSQAVSRLALRDGDRIQIGQQEISIHMGTASPISLVSEPTEIEDLSQLTADELCDCLLEEEAVIAEYEEGQMKAWEALINALDTILSTEDPSPVIPSPITSAMTRELARVQQKLSDRRLVPRKEIVAIEKECSTEAETHYQRLDQLLLAFQEGELRATA